MEQQISQKKSRSLTQKLRDSFIGVSLFSLLAAIVGIGSYQIIEQEQNEVLDISVPAALGAERIAKLGLSVVATTPTLLAARNERELQRHTWRTQIDNKDSQIVLAQMRELGISPQLLDKIEKDLKDEFSTLETQISLVKTRNKQNAQITEHAVLARNTARQLIEILKPNIVEASAALLDRSDEIRKSLTQPFTVGANTLEQFELLAEKDYYRVERLIDMQFRAESIINDVDELLLTVDRNGVERLRNDLSLNLRSLTRNALNVEDRSLRQQLGEKLRNISTPTQGDNNIFTLRSSFIEITKKLDELSSRNLKRSQRLQVSVEKLLSESSALIANSTDQARRAVTLGRIILTTIAITAFIVAVGFIWQFVIKGIANRIRRLENITNELAKGNVDIDVDVMGGDELGRMADAVRVFKKNATELRRSNSDLARMNEHLEQFTYIVSHDLRAPLRGIRNSAQWIEEDLGDETPSEVKGHVARLQKQTGRLGNLLNDLLEYSRIGTNKFNAENVDLEALVRNIADYISTDKPLKIDTGSGLPTIRLYQTPLSIVFQNLIENAAKYSDKAETNVKISYRRDKSLHHFSVQDDGPGILPQDHEKIFLPFRKLKNGKEISGNGMGLALVKKAIETHGGKINISSSPPSEAGTTFNFTWPAT